MHSSRQSGARLEAFVMLVRFTCKKSVIEDDRRGDAQLRPACVARDGTVVVAAGAQDTVFAVQPMEAHAAQLRAVARGCQGGKRTSAAFALTLAETHRS